MDRRSFNVPQFYSIIDNALKELKREKQELDNEQNNLATKMDLFEWAKDCVATIQNELKNAYDKTNSQQHEIEVLQQRLYEEQEQRKKDAQMVASVSKISKDNENLRLNIATISKQYEKMSKELEEHKIHNAFLDMQLKETQKLSKKHTHKEPDDVMIDVIRKYINISKNKTQDKRAVIKTVILEIVMQNSLVLPNDLVAVINSLDDERYNPKVVNISGNYNDIHDNGNVNQK